MSPLLLLPRSTRDWETSAREEGVRKTSILKLSNTNSASKSTIPQYLALRALFATRDVIGGMKYFRDNPQLCGQEYLDQSRDEIGTELKEYSDEINSSTHPKKAIGAYSMVRYYQYCVTKSNDEMRAKGLDQLNPTAFDALTPKVFSTPVAYRTRLRMASSPTRSNLPPGAGQQTETLNQMGHSPHSVASSLGGKLSGDEDPYHYGSGHESSSAASIISPANPNFSPTAEDEQIVNTAILLLLNTLTAYRSKLREEDTCGEDNRVEWTMKRKAFRVGTIEARTDGFLRDTWNITRAIIEVKPFVRRVSPEKFICKKLLNSRLGFPPSLLTIQQRVRMGNTVSQDSIEIYLTVAEFDDEYVQYVTNPEHPVDKDNPSLMKLILMGPWFIIDSKHMRDLCRILLGFTIRQFGISKQQNGASTSTLDPGNVPAQRGNIFPDLPIRQSSSSSNQPVTPPQARTQPQQGESSRQSSKPRESDGHRPEEPRAKGDKGSKEKKSIFGRRK